MIISATKLIATAVATEIMLLPGLPTESWLVSPRTSVATSSVPRKLFSHYNAQGTAALPICESIVCMGGCLERRYCNLWQMYR